MSWLIELFELLNSCSPERAGAYMFFIVLLSYLITKIIFDGISNIVFIIYGYKKLKKGKEDENAKQVL
jgi:hypothetical protein